MRTDAVDVQGASAEVIRRQPDGTWRYVIDHPFGAAPSGAAPSPPVSAGV
jgi:ketosteroid isomerase-like protein